MSKIRDQIIELLSDPKYRPLESLAVSKKLQVTKKGMKKFRETVAELIESGQLREGKKGRLRLKTTAGFVTGVVRRIKSGAAFVIPHEVSEDLEKKDVYVSRSDLTDAQTGDEVLVRLISRRRSGGQRCGRVEKVLERASNVFVGTYFESQGQGFVRVDGNVFDAAIHVGDPGSRGAKADDKVVIEILRFPSANRVGEAVLTDVLGDPGVDTMTVVHGLGLPHEFSEAALDDARGQAELFDEKNLDGRLDLTKEMIVTIDPATARDFDDAISLRRDRRGHWQLGVHIADVAHFVTPGGALDRSAQERGTSVYLPRHVIPMLPEVISNGLASLQEGQVRYTKSVFIEFDAEGNPLGAELANTVIRVSRRFAYEEVMPLIKKPESGKGRVSATILKLLQKMYTLAMVLRRRRFAGGALQMGIPEVEIDFDDDGNITGAHESHHDESHEIIEEFMLAANIAVAQLLTAKEIPYLRRVHGHPDESRLKNFQDFCLGLGYELDQFRSRAALQQVILDAAGQPEERALNFGLLRAMKQAVYSPEDYGHFALNEDHYCHFTSPIRRYPDLTIHRIVGELAAGRKVRPDNMGELLQLGKNCSLTERRAEKAERELKRIKLLRYMETRVGEELDAFITGVESFGMFCQGVKIPVEGMVHISALTDDFYTYDPACRTLTGGRKKLQYRLGDAVRVVVTNVDLDRRQLDLRIVPETDSTGSRKAANPTARTQTGARQKSPAGEQVTGGARKRPAKKKPTSKSAGSTKKKSTGRRRRR
ncbi:MAG: ribonuclease R [Planctomycetaceae bacterium]